MEEEYIAQQPNQPLRTTIQAQELLAKRKLAKKPKKKKKSYDIIPYEKRVELLDLILNQKETIKSSANKLGIKLCTAKHILYLYKNQGKIHERKQDQQCSDSQWSEPRQYKKPGQDKKQLSEKLEDSQLLFISQSFSQKNESTPKQNKKGEEQLKQLQNSGKKTQVGSQQQTEKEKKENNVSICYVPIPVPIFNLMGEASLESLLASWPWNLNLLNDSFNI